MTPLERLAGGHWEPRETATTETPEAETPRERTPKPGSRRPERDPERSKAAMERLMGGRWEA